MPKALLQQLSALGMELRAESDRLNWRAPEGAMTQELLGRIRANKAGLLALLHQKGHERKSQKKLCQLIRGDCLAVMKQMPNNSIDLIATDPPYGIKFMGKDWDRALPDPKALKECLRVLKPGGFAFVLCSPRQDVLSKMIGNLEQAGFETGFSSIYWTYASGFPKAHNIGKAVAKKMGAEDAIEFDGAYAGFQPKPAVEVVLVAMKPCEEKTYTKQAMENGKGSTWMDDCRIPYGDEVPSIRNRHKHDRGEGYGFKPAWQQKGGVVWTPEKEWKQDVERQAHEKGRFPANLLISDDVIDDGRNHLGGTFPKRRGKTEYFGLDNLKSGYVGRLNDSGGYSRFFSLDAWAIRNLPFLVVPKASKKEKNAGLESFTETRVQGKGHGLNRVCEYCGAPQLKSYQCKCEKKSWILPKAKNTHPTVKPIKLMAYLITLGSRKGDIVFDPFCGSGTTCLAAHLLGRGIIGIEKDPEHFEIASARMRALTQQTHFKKNKE